MPRVLTDRQGDVLLRLCEGRSEQAIAAEFGITPATVQQHLYLIRHRLGATEFVDLCALGADDVAAAVARAHRRAETP